MSSQKVRGSAGRALEWKDAKANCRQPADSCTCSERDGEWWNAKKGHPIADQLAVEMVPLIGARPPPVLLVVAGGRTGTTLMAAMAAAAAAGMTMVARVTVAAARSRSAGQEARHRSIGHGVVLRKSQHERVACLLRPRSRASLNQQQSTTKRAQTNTPDLFSKSWITLTVAGA